MIDQDVTVSADTLDRLPSKVFTFLTAVGSVAAVWEALAVCGYSTEVHKRGWALLDEVSGRVTMAPMPMSAQEATVEKAEAEIDAWDDRSFAIARATWQHRFPEQYAYVFAKDLQPVRGHGSVLSSLTFLRRLEALESSPERAATRAQDHAALAALAERGIDHAQRDRMMSLIESVQQGASAPMPPTPAKARTAKTAQPSATPRDAKRELYVWFAEWSGVARAVVKQRASLIRMGLASRRKPKPVAPTPRVPTQPARPSVAPPQ